MNKHFEIIFSYGFRPFFLGCSIYAVIVMAAFLGWIGVHYAGGDIIHLPFSMAPYTWHAHEMLFGFAIAAVAGFLLTAVPSWTDTRAVHSKTLCGLFILWLVGRVAIWFSTSFPIWLTAVGDLVFIPVLGVLVIGALSKGWSKRNLVFVPLLGGFFVANLLFHLERMDIFVGGIDTGHRLAVDLLALLITIIGGRVVPAFTTNALRRRGEPRLPVNHAQLNVFGIACVALFVIADTVLPEAAVTGWLGLAAAMANGARLAGWRGMRTLAEPIVAVLHVGYGWLVIGLGLKAWAILGGTLSPQTALHALTAGAAGTMILAVMSRAALGHTGREIVAGRAAVAAYILVSVAALVRIATPWMFPEFYNEGMLIAGIGWIAAFSLFVAGYWGILTGPRKSETP